MDDAGSAARGNGADEDLRIGEDAGLALTEGRNFASLGLTSSSSDGQDEEETEMSAEVWGNLPDHLTEGILAKLPVQSFLRFRAVCKKWSALISDESFLAACSRPPERPPLFLLYANHARRSYPVYDPAASAWSLLPQAPSSSLAVVAVAGGLLCLADADGPVGQDFGLAVFNPITKARRVLPPPTVPMPFPYVVGMVADRRGYKILMAQNGESVVVQVYDSAAGEWRMTDSIRKRLALVVGGACLDGVLYCVAFGVEVGVCAYHLEEGTWEDVRAPMPSPLSGAELFEGGGSVRLAAAVVTDLGSPKHICVWQLDRARTEWVHLLTVPDSFLETISPLHLSPIYYFVARGDYLCFARHQVDLILMCNVAKKTWWWLPPCPFPEYVDSNSFSGFFLQPRLDASV